MVKDNIKIVGRFQLYENGKLIIDRENLLTEEGAKLYANMISGDNSVEPNYLAIDGTSGTYTKYTTSLFSEILRKVAGLVTSPEKISKREFILNENEAIGQIYGFGLVTASSGGIFANLINQSFNHILGKTLKIIWSIEVVV